MRNHSLDGKPPVSEPRTLKLFELIIRRSHGVGKRNLRDHAARELASERISAEQAVSGVGERFTGSENPSAIGWNESVSPGQFRSYGQAGDAGRCRQAGGHELTT